MSWLFSRALEAEFLAATCSAGEPSSPSSVMPTQHPFWWRDKTTDFSRRSPFGQTLPVLTADRGEALLTWFREASRARTSALPAKEPELMARALDSGATWRASLARFDRESSSWRTAQRSFFGESGESSVTWPRSGMTADGQCWELPMSGRRIRETDSGLWVPTPIRNDAEKRGNFDPIRSWGLAGFARLWPTPTAYNGLDGRSNSRAASMKAGQAVPSGGQLNPTWVEWLMGWPLGWTDLEHSATDRCHSAPLPLSECSQEAETA